MPATTWTNREGEQYLARVLQERKAPLQGMASGLAPMTMTEIDYRADVVRYRMEYLAGKAQIVSGGVTEHPRVSTSAAEATRPIRMAVIGGTITQAARERGEFAGRNVATATGAAMLRALMEFVDDTIFTGQTAHGIEGILTHPGIPRTFMTETFAAGGTVDTQMSEVLTAVDSRMTTTKMSSGSFDSLAISPAHWQYAANKKRSTSVDRSMLEDMRQSRVNIQRPINIIALNRLTGAGPNGGDIMIAFDSNRIDLGGYAVPSGRLVDRYDDFVKHGDVEMKWRTFTAGFWTDFPVEYARIIVPSGS